MKKGINANSNFRFRFKACEASNFVIKIWDTHANIPLIENILVK